MRGWNESLLTMLSGLAAAALLAGAASARQTWWERPGERPGERVRLDASGRALLLPRAPRESLGDAPPPALPSAADWSALGPFGGDVTDVAASPVDAGLLLAGTAPGGGAGGTLYRSLDAGASWHEVPDLSGLSVHDIEFDDTGRAYVATDDSVWKSVDGGASFTQLSLGVGASDRVLELSIDPADDRHVWIGLHDAFGGQPQLVLESTTGGASWTPRTPPLAAPASCRALAVDPGDSQRVVAGFGGSFGGGELWVSTDGGASWTDRSAGLPPHPVNDLAYDGARLLVAGGALFGGADFGLYESIDDGQTWAPLSDASWPSLVVQDIELDPHDPLRILLATAGGGVFESVDGGALFTFGKGGTAGQTLNEISLDPLQPGRIQLGASSLAVQRSLDDGQSFQAAAVGIGSLSVRDVAVDPLDPSELALCFHGLNEGGVYRSTDAGASWALEPLPPVRFTRVAYSPAGELYALSDGPTTVAPEGVYRLRAGSWSALGPDVGAFLETELDALTFRAARPELLLAGGGDFGFEGLESAVWRSDDDGATWTRVYEGAGADEDVRDFAWVEDGLDAVVLACFTDDGPAGSGGCLKSADAGLTWAEASSGLGASAQPVTLSAEPGAPDAFVLADRGALGGLRRTTDAAATWTALGASGALLGAVHDPTGNGRLYAIASALPRVRASDDGGLSFVPFDAGLAGVGVVRALAPDPTGSPLLHLATDAGVYSSPLDLPYVPTCLGDGSGTPCPCGNEGDPGEGCGNSLGHGARLGASGSSAVVADELVLTVSQARPDKTGVFLQGGTAISSPFRDGLLCVGNPTERLEFVQLDPAGGASSSVSIVTEGAVQAGQTRWYQVWYRDGMGPCGSGSNLSHALRVDWL